MTGTHGFSDEELDDLLDERDAAKARVRTLQQVLRKIACFEDKISQRHFEKTGSYLAFNEPVSVALAREFLEGV